MKKVRLMLLIAIMACTLFLTGCTNSTAGNKWIVESYAPTSEYEANVGDMFLDSSVNDLYQMTESGWDKISNIGGLDGKDGTSVTVEISDDGYWVINGVKTTSKAVCEDGKNGKDGKAGKMYTIEISDDGYWVIDGTKIDSKAIGEDGKDGQDGQDGIDGTTPTIEIKDGNWYVNGVDTTIRAEGKDGQNSTVEIKNNFWYINGDNTGLRVSDYVCKRASKLHTETCTSGASCTNKYSVNSIIEYGNLGSANNLVSGDAFDCDVNGDGVFDSETERFYYMSDYYDATSNTFNTNVAVLVYYSNVAFGSAEPSYAVGYAYPDNTTNNGPVNAAKHMPEIGNWSNVYLINTNRQIVNEKGIAKVEDITISKYNYSGYAARLITTQEIEKACDIVVGKAQKNELLSCEYLLEGTEYSGLSGHLSGYILETPRSTYFGTTPVIHAVFGGNDSSVANSVYNGIGAKYVAFYGVRPAIEVSKSRIAY